MHSSSWHRRGFSVFEIYIYWRSERVIWNVIKATFLVRIEAQKRDFQDISGRLGCTSEVSGEFQRVSGGFRRSLEVSMGHRGFQRTSRRSQGVLKGARCFFKVSKEFPAELPGTLWNGSKMSWNTPDAPSTIVKSLLRPSKSPLNLLKYLKFP